MRSINILKWVGVALIILVSIVVASEAEAQTTLTDAEISAGV
jgi:hypothetical protein